MSEENVGLAQTSANVFNRGDLEYLLGRIHDEAPFVDPCLTYSRLRMNR
jgi:hypothetical protein